MTTVWTVGHSTRSGEEFVQILMAHEIQVLVDVRSFPGSRRYPQFNRSSVLRVADGAWHRVQTRAATWRAQNAASRFTQHCLA